MKQDDQHVKQIKTLSKTQIAKLVEYRIIQKHLVYVIGLSSNTTDKEILNKPEYFGQYGQINKLIANKNKAYNPSGSNGPSYSAYITYNSPNEAALAILSTDNIEMNGHTIKSSFGTTKYCTIFLKGKECPNKECLYLHYLAPRSEVITKDDANTNKLIFSQQQNLAIKLADIFNIEVRKKLTSPKSFTSVLPSTKTIYQRDFVMEVDPFKSEQQNNKANDYTTPINLVKKYAEIDFNKDAVATRVNNFTEKIENNDTDASSQKSGDETEKHKLVKEDSVIADSPQKEMKNIYRSREQSRFSFVEEKKEGESINVPEYINKFLHKKFSGHSFFKKNYQQAMT